MSLCVHFDDFVWSAMYWFPILISVPDAHDIHRLMTLMTPPETREKTGKTRTRGQRSIKENERDEGVVDPSHSDIGPFGTEGRDCVCVCSVSKHQKIQDR